MGGGHFSARSASAAYATQVKVRTCAPYQYKYQGGRFVAARPNQGEGQGEDR